MTNITQRSKPIRAFTLLEMIMVIIIIGVLIASLAYFKPNSDPIKEQQKFGNIAATKLFDEIKSTQLEIIRNNSILFWTEKLALQNITFKTENKIANVLKLNKQYRKDHVEHLEFWYKDKNYINKVIWLNWDKNYITINNTNSFNNNWIIETQSCDIKTEKICIPISKIYFNKAAQTITQYFCKEVEYSKWEYICIDKERKNKIDLSSSSINLWWNQTKE